MIVESFLDPGVVLTFHAHRIWSREFRFRSQECSVCHVRKSQQFQCFT